MSSDIIDKAFSSKNPVGFYVLGGVALLVGGSAITHYYSTREKTFPHELDIDAGRGIGRKKKKSRTKKRR